MGKVNRISHMKLVNYASSSNLPLELLNEIISWPDLIKSPYGLSFYSAPVDWNYKEDKSFRVSNHWNFLANDFRMHCKTDIEVPKDFWALGQFDSNLKIYKILQIYKPLSDHLSRISDFQLLKLNVLYDYTIKNNLQLEQKINYSFLKKYYKILERN